MNKLSIIAVAIALSSSWLSSCNSQENVNNNDSENNSATSATGTLSLVANGEDFVRQGFVTKDGWQINFDHVYVSLAEVKAYATENPFDPTAAEEIKPTEEVILLSSPQTVDLAAGDENASPIAVAETDVPASQYNALSWKLVTATEEPIAGQSLVLDGTAEKDGQTIDFVMGFDQPLDYLCGEFVGEDRKGIVTAAAKGEVETTFHFDHIFGDRSTPATDALNQDALGFQPLAKLATQGKLDIDQAGLEQQLSSEDYQKLMNAVVSLGHVGEGHCALQSQ